MNVETILIGSLVVMMVFCAVLCAGSVFLMFKALFFED